jgi:cytochrome c biogenesis protein CcmG/thiol:disulfide interchange protein DsbE
MLETTSEPDKQSEPQPKRGPSRRLLWSIAALSGLVMVVAAWQLRSSDSEAPTATEAFNEAAGEVARESATNFTVPLLSGGEFDLDRHLADTGKPVLLNLWASWCIPCRNEMPLLDDVAPLYPDVVFLGVAVNDSRSDAEEFATEIGVTYPIAFDTANEVVEHFPAPAMPVTYIIRSDGTVNGRFFGELTTDRIDELLRDVD